jgi:uncharacterized protein
MAQDRLRYDRMIDDALRGVVRKALADVAERGLPGGHHFLITFKTHAPGVEIPDYLRERYPDTISIMLQFEFWDLEVDEKRFAVTLSFSDVQERLVVPLPAITGFVDPFAKFRLEFQAQDQGEAAVADRRERRTAAKPAEASKAAAKESDGNEAAKGAEVVTLDAFRKK